MKKVGLLLGITILPVITTWALEGLSLSVQGPDVSLRWPSGTNDSYCVQYRATLNSDDTWQTVTNALRAAAGTNWTTFIHSNAVCYPTGGGNGGGGSSDGPPVLEGYSSSSQTIAASYPPTPPPLPVPWDPSTWGSSTNANNLLLEATTEESSSDEESQSACTGFYRVWHVPDFPSSITNYSFEGPIFIPVDFKDYRDRVANVEVLFDGQPTTEAEFTSFVVSGQTNWGMGIYFDRFTNGIHQIQLLTTLHLNEEIGDSAAYIVLSNAVKPILVNNAVTFAEWDDFMQGSNYTYKAKLSSPNADWWIDIYDAWGFYVNTGSGHTTNGVVEWTWDLNDYLGYNRDEFESDPYFYGEISFDDGAASMGTEVVSAASGGSSPVPMPPVVKGYPNTGEWIIAYQDRWYADAWGYNSDLQGIYNDTISAIGGGPLLLNETVWWQGLKFGTNVWSQSEREYSWTNLLAWIGDLHIKNLYYHGHGGAKSIGCDMHVVTTNGLVTGGTTTSRNSKSEIFSWQIAQKTKLNRFRFVYLDGCSTAEGDLPNAFNVSKTTHTLDFYENNSKHPRPSVFVGWNQTVGGDGWGTAYKRLEFQSYWMANWVNTFPYPSIEDALKTANVGANWVPQSQLLGALRIYGYKQMRARDYNKKGDWTWP